MEAVYTFVAEDGEVIHVLVDRLRALVESHFAPVYCPMTPSVLRMLEEGRLGVEEDHALSLPEPAMDAPLLFVQLPGDQHMMVDGAHRLWRRWKAGRGGFMAYIAPEPVWRPFQIDLPGSAEYWHNHNITAKVR